MKILRRGGPLTRDRSARLDAPPAVFLSEHSGRQDDFRRSASIRPILITRASRNRDLIRSNEVLWSNAGSLRATARTARTARTGHGGTFLFLARDLIRFCLRSAGTCSQFAKLHLRQYNMLRRKILLYLPYCPCYPSRIPILIYLDFIARLER